MQIPVVTYSNIYGYLYMCVLVCTFLGPCSDSWKGLETMNTPSMQKLTSNTVLQQEEPGRLGEGADSRFEPEI